MILVTGAGGKTGRVLIETLSKVESLRAFVHRQSSVPVVKSLGAEKVTVGDLLDESALEPALEGARAVYHICPNMSPGEIQIGKQVIRQALKTGVEHFVYHSVLHPQTEKMAHHWGKLRVEELILESGLSYTILQPAPYMQNLLAGWEKTLEDGVLRVPYSVYSKFSFIDLADLAEAAKIILSEAGHRNATYELAGTAPISHAEVGEIMKSVLNRPIRAEQEEISEWRLRAVGINKYALENLVKMFEYYDKWGLSGNPNVLRWILGREPASLENFIQRSMKKYN
jgi:NAD(P)H dehydrogenase (quinone)